MKKNKYSFCLVFFLFLFSNNVIARNELNGKSACPFPIEDVILEDSWVKKRENLNIEYLKSLNPDRLLYNFKVNSGFPSSALPLSGWESPEIGLRGHFVGHYLSAISFIVRKYNDAFLSERLHYMINELYKCQQALGEGYLSAFPKTEFDKLEKNESGIWAPYYTYHKIMQGLLDVFVNTENKKAYDMLCGMADYVNMRMSRLDSTIIAKMLYTTQANPSNEAGGMNEVLYNLYYISQNEKYLRLAKIFDRRWFLNPLINNEDILDGLHSNTHIALVNGFAKCYQVTKNPLYYDAVVHFWEILNFSHAYANGTSSGPRPNVTTPVSLTSEHWGKAGQLSNTLTGEIAETCVSHNTQKLTRQLFEWTQLPQYANAYMNTFYNAVMAEQNDETGAFVYHLPLGSPRRKKFLDSYADFRCCNGSSIEAFSLLNNSIYFYNKNQLWVNLYVPTKLDWKEYGVKIRQSGDFLHNQESKLTFELEKPQHLSINLFIPSCGGQAKIYVNKRLEGVGTPNSFFTLDRKWNDNDCISIQFSFDFQIVPMPDDNDVIAIFYGPMLLAFQSSDEIDLYGSPIEILSQLSVLNMEDLTFLLKQTDRKYYLRPLFKIRNEHYSVYVHTNKLVDY